MTGRVVELLQTAGHEVISEDLYAEGFDAAMSREERMTYYRDQYSTQAVTTQVEHLLTAQAIVLVFPTWWFGFPAILKGWFDRVWGPGLGQIAQVTQQTTAHAEQCAAAAQKFSSQAQHLDRILRRFKVNRAALSSAQDTEAKELPELT